MDRIQPDEYLRDELRVFVVPVDIFDVPGLTCHEQMVYMVLRSHCSAREMTAFPSYATIAREGRMSRDKAIQAMKKLIELGLVSKTEQYTMNKHKKVIQTANTYTIHTPKGSRPQRPGGSSSTTRVVVHNDQGSRSQRPKHNHLTDPSEHNHLNTHTHEAFAGIRETSATNERPEERTKTNEPNERVCKEIQSILEDKGIRVHIKTLQSWLQIADPEDIVYAAELATKDGVRSPAGFIGSILRNGIIRTEKKDKRDLQDSRYEAFYRLFPNS